MTDTSMRERLARAIYQRRNGHGAKPWAHQPKAHQEPYLADADAVLDELMTPTEGMLKQSFAAMNDTPSGEWKRLKAAGLTERQMFDAKMRPRYTAMIKAAKEGK